MGQSDFPWWAWLVIALTIALALTLGLVFGLSNHNKVEESASTLPKPIASAPRPPSSADSPPTPPAPSSNTLTLGAPTPNFLQQTVVAIVDLRDDSNKEKGRIVRLQRHYPVFNDGDSNGDDFIIGPSTIVQPNTEGANYYDYIVTSTIYTEGSVQAGMDINGVYVATKFPEEGFLYIEVNPVVAYFSVESAAQGDPMIIQCTDENVQYVLTNSSAFSWKYTELDTASEVANPFLPGNKTVKKILNSYPSGLGIIQSSIADLVANAIQLGNITDINEVVPVEKLTIGQSGSSADGGGEACSNSYLRLDFFNQSYTQQVPKAMRVTFPNDFKVKLVTDDTISADLDALYTSTSFNIVFPSPGTDPIYGVSIEYCKILQDYVGDTDQPITFFYTSDIAFAENFNNVTNPMAIPKIARYSDANGVTRFAFAIYQPRSDLFAGLIRIREPMKWLEAQVYVGDDSFVVPFTDNTNTSLCREDSAPDTGTLTFLEPYAALGVLGDWSA
tara:strand:- start:33362 stop:34867 length:1506 start_codon:yes stop_codon:yes gene_type:complete